MGLTGSTEPRIYTPPLRPLTPATSLGFAVIEFARDVVRVPLLPWQEWFLIHALELREDGGLRFRTVVLLMARQNGKSTLSQILGLWWMFVYGKPLVIGTAQDLDVAEEIWQGAVDLVEDTPDLNAQKDHVVRVNGKKALVLKTGERWKVKAANRRAGRGLSGDLVLLDELREHQSWDAWGAITKTTMARRQALIFVMSNAGDATSVVLRYLRKLGHAALGDPDGVNAVDTIAEAPPEEDDEVEDDTLGLFEWSAKPGAPVRDREGIRNANPAVGYTIDERTILAAAKTDPEWVFRTEVLCQWSDGTLQGPFPTGSWEASQDPASTRHPEHPVALCVDVSWDRAFACVGLASTRADGRAHIEVIARRAGTEWLVGWLTSDERAEDVRNAPVAVQANGAPSSALIPGLEAAGVKVVPWGGPALTVGTGEFYDRVRTAIGEGSAANGGERKELRHRGQPVLNLAAATAATRPLGDAWLWDRRHSPTDVAPLIAVTGALWCLQHGMPRRSAYESRRLEVF